MISAKVFLLQYPFLSMRSTSAGIFLISCGALLFEISLTRIFSVSRWYHFAFMVVSIALLGFAASGSLLNLFPGIRKNPHSPYISSLLFSVSVVFSFFLSDKIEMDPYRILLEPYLLGSIAVYYFLLSLPFLFAGFSISILLSEAPEKAGFLYGCNLAGSAVGCLLIFSFSVFGSKIILLSAVLGIFSSFFFAHPRRQKLFSILMLIFLLFLPQNVYSITMSPYKALPLALNYPGAEILSTEWNAISRVDIVKSPLRHAPGLSLSYTEGLPSQLGLTIDGDNISSLSEPAPYIEYLPTAAAYLVPRNKVLIINPQGLDIATAKYYQAEITITEGNPLIVTSSKKYSPLYTDIHIASTDGRTFLASTDTKYDLIQISLSESIFASSVGLYGFNESYLFTEEAFQEYYAHLEEDGLLVINRWLLLPPRELPKLVSLVCDTVENPEEHVVIFRSYSTTTLLLKKTPFSDTRDIEKFCKERGYDLVWTPTIREDQVNIYNQFEEPYFYEMVKSQFSDNTRVKREYLFNIESPTDDDPFFFNFFRWRKAQDIYDSLQGRWQPFFEGGFMAVLILVQAIVLSFFLIIPLKRLPGRRVLFYFVFIGLGFMCVEVPLMQQFILFLGQPTYSVAFVLSSILLFSGLGSYTSQRIGWKRGFLFLEIFLLALLSLSLIIHSFLGFSLHWKILIGLVVIGPLSFFMGIPFPCGIKELEAQDVPSAWCVNGCASVCGSVVAVMVALSLGFRVVVVVGILCYSAAFAVRRY